MYYSHHQLDDRFSYETAPLKDLLIQIELYPLFHFSCFICNSDENVMCDDMAGNAPAYITVVDGEFF